MHMQDAQNELACTDANARVDVIATVKWVDVRASDGLVLRTMHGILLYLTSEICCIHVDAELCMGHDHADCVGDDMVNSL